MLTLLHNVVKNPNPPDAIVAILWKTSIFIPLVAAICIYWGARASRAIPIPPEDEPVAPASKVTAKASEISGLALRPKSKSVNVWNPGTIFTTPPNPTTAAVFKIAITAPFAPSLRAFVKRLDF